MANLGEFEVYREPQGKKAFIGYNDTLPPEQLPAGYLALIKNGFCDTGSIVRRTGYIVFGNDLGDTQCQALKGVRFSTGTKEVIGVFAGLIYKWTGSGNWAALTGTYTLNDTGYVEIVIANDNLYFFDGTNTVPKYNGTTVSTVGTIPKGTIALWFHGQLHVAGITNDGNALKSSTIGDPETFSGGTSSDIDVNANDGDYITGLKDLGDSMYVCKTQRVWEMSGFGTAALTLDDLNGRISGFGTIAPRSLIVAKNDLLYIGFLGNKPIIRSLKLSTYSTTYDAGSISDDISNTMNGLNKTALNTSAAGFDGRYAWFAVANGSSTYNNLVLTYDTEKKGWTQHTGINASCFDYFSISSTPQMYFGEAGLNSKAYRFDTSTSDNGTAIDFEVKTRRYGVSQPESKKKFKWLYTAAVESGDYDIDIAYSGDGFTFQSLGTLNLGGTGSIFDNIILDHSRFGTTDINRERITIPKSRNYYMQFKFSNSSTDAAIDIRNWELYYIIKTPTDL